MEKKIIFTYKRKGVTVLEMLVLKLTDTGGINSSIFIVFKCL